jgi:acyl-coenzyme A synthetase/AMP-(fatty) acid ligase
MGALDDDGFLMLKDCSKDARFKRPKHYRFVASLPKNKGKVLKTALREMLARGDSEC